MFGVSDTVLIMLLIPCFILGTIIRLIVWFKRGNEVISLAFGVR